MGDTVIISMKGIQRKPLQLENVLNNKENKCRKII